MLIASLLAVICSANVVMSFDHYEAGKTAFNKKNYVEANKYFNIALKENPRNINYRYYYAQTLVYLLKLDDAQKEYERIIELAPNSNAAKLSAAGIAKIQGYLISQKNNYKSSVNNKQNIQNKIKAELLSGIGENYIDFAPDNGLIVHWNTRKMPIKIYIQKPENIPGGQSYYVSAIKNAFDSWVSSLNGVIKYEIINDPNSANIFIVFVPMIDSGEGAKEHKGFVSGLATPHTANNILDFVDIKFTTLKMDKRPYSETEIYNTALHEIGHALGIMGHSDKQGDIMYPVSSEAKKTVKSSLSQRDIDTIKLLYRLDADVSNYDQSEIAKNKPEKNSVVLGDVNSRLEKKLQEAKDYTQKVPYHPISWTSLGTAYYNLKKYYEAISAYKKALQLDPNYIQARVGLAGTYRDMGDFSNTVLEYQTLISKEPAKIEYSNNLALFYVNNNKYSEARSVINSLILKNPKAKDDENIKRLILQLQNH